MNWEALAASAELLGSVAVLTTLIYLSVQTRHARMANEASNQWQRANASRELAMLWATSPESVELLAEFGQLDEETLHDVRTNPRYFRYVKINQAHLETLQAIYITAGTEEERALAVERLKGSMSLPGFRQSWKHIPHSVFRTDFVEIVESFMEQTDA
jgi:hypothetical protein